MIKIVSGWSNAGGSTQAFINLTNALNQAGYETTFYGPHEYPSKMNKCKFEQIGSRKLVLNEEDTVIFHFTNKVDRRLPVKTQIFSCHEQNIFPLKTEVKYEFFDKIHYVSEHQRKYHNIDHPYFVIPNIIEKIKPCILTNKIGGIISSIDRNKRVDYSIKRALDDGCEKVLIYGMISDQWYWTKQVAPLVDGNRVIYKGYEENKQKMYDSFSDLYFSSEMECAPYVLGEAQLAEKILHTIVGKNYVNTKYEYDNDKIIQAWIKELCLE